MIIIASWLFQFSVMSGQYTYVYHHEVNFNSQFIPVTHKAKRNYIETAAAAYNVNRW